MLQYVYTKVTGEKGNRDGTLTGDTRNAWDPFFESQGGGTIYNTLFNLSNAHIHTLSVSATPMEDVSAKLSATTLFTYTDLQGTGGAGYPGTTTLTLIQPDAAGDTPIVKADKDVTHLGTEVDFDLGYDYTEDVKIGTSLGWFFPGSLFRSSVSDEDRANSGDANENVAKQLIVHMDVKF